VVALAAALAGVSALHPEFRELSDGMRESFEIGRLLQAADAQTAAVASCVNALVPPSITSFYKCIGVNLVLVASGLDAGMLLAPIVLWPLIVISLPASFEAAPVQRASQRPAFALRGRA
jgi:hypothetical protein